MSEPVLNLITYPDKLFNDNTSLLLVNPSDTIKENFNHYAQQFQNDVNLYLYENSETDLRWLLEVSETVDSTFSAVTTTSSMRRLEPLSSSAKANWDDVAQANATMPMAARNMIFPLN